MKTKTKVVLAISAVVVPGLAFLAVYVDWCMSQQGPGPDIVCHKQIDGAFEQWKIETTNAA